MSSNALLMQNFKLKIKTYTTDESKCLRFYMMQNLNWKQRVLVYVHVLTSRF